MERIYYFIYRCSMDIYENLELTWLMIELNYWKMRLAHMKLAYKVFKKMRDILVEEKPRTTLQRIGTTFHLMTLSVAFVLLRPIFSLESIFEDDETDTDTDNQNQQK